MKSLKPVPLIERGFALLVAAVLSPALGLAALAILLDDGFPVFFSQDRIGLNQLPFRLWKLRTMRVRQDRGPEITSAEDPRITRIGRLLRNYKLDEIPQLWNVFLGEMSLIGPRPEVPAYVEVDDPLWMSVLSLRPGITDLSSLIFRREEELLALVPDPETYYRTVVLPQKLWLSWRYNQERTLLSDVRLIAATIYSSIRPSAFNAKELEQTFLTDHGQV